jgi:hypothetical protein
VRKIRKWEGWWGRRTGRGTGGATVADEIYAGFLSFFLKKQMEMPVYMVLFFFE